MKIVICAGTYDNTLCGWEWDLATRALENATAESPAPSKLQPVFAVRAHVGCIKCLDTKGKILATGGDDEVINVFDVVERTEVGKIMKLTGSVSCVEMYGHSHLLAGSSTGVLSIHRMSDWEPLWTVKAHNGYVRCVSVHPSGRLALTVGDDQKLKMWNLIRGRIAYSTKLKAECELVRWSPTGQSFAFTGLRAINVYDSTTGDAKNTLEHTKKVIAFTYLTENILVSGGEDRTVYLWNTDTAKCIHKIENHTNRIRAISSIRIGEEAYIVVSVDSDGDLCIWNVSKEAGESSDWSLKLEHHEKTGARFTCVDIVDYGMSTYLRNKRKQTAKVLKQKAKAQPQD